MIVPSISAILSPKTINARKGVKTRRRVNRKRDHAERPKTINARKGVKTQTPLCTAFRF